MRDVTAKATVLHSMSQLIIFIPDSALRLMGNLVVAGGEGEPPRGDRTSFQPAGADHA